MKKSIRIFIRFLSIGMILLGNTGFGESDQPVGRLTFFIGDIRVRPSGQSTWDKAVLNHEVFNGSSIRAGEESRAELMLSDQNVIRIGENAIFDVEDFELEDGKLTGQASLPFGRMWSKVKRLGNKGLKVRSPNAVMAIRGTVFRADAHPDSSLSVYVYKGRVDVNRLDNLPDQSLPDETIQPQHQQQSGPPVPVKSPDLIPVPGPYEVTLQEWLQIVEGMRLNLRPDGRYDHGKFDIAQDREDDWVNWNMQRDSQTR